MVKWLNPLYWIMIYIYIYMCVCVCVCVKCSLINHGLNHNVLLWLNPTFDQDSQVPMLKTTTEALPVTVVALLQCTNWTRHERKQIKNKCWNLKFAEVKAKKKSKCVWLKVVKNNQHSQNSIQLSIPSIFPSTASAMWLPRPWQLLHKMPRWRRRHCQGLVLESQSVIIPWSEIRPPIFSPIWG